MSKVFISYSHKDEDWKDRVVGHLRVLEAEAGYEIWDDRRIEGGQDWQPAIEQAIDGCSVALLLVSMPFLISKFILGVEIPRLLKMRTEAGVRVIPVILKPCAWQRISWLKTINARPKDGKPLLSMSEADAEFALALLAEEVAGILKSARSASANNSSSLPPEFISLAKLPAVSPNLFGREKEMALLDSAWVVTDTAKKFNVFPIIAWGGVGKSALAICWLERVRADGWRGAQRVFGWSFYSQGSSEDRQASADSFVNHLLGWLGEKDFAEKSPWDKGSLLAQAIRRERILLILDGIEPLQHPDGRLRDDALKALLKELAWSNPGLCIVTSRLPLTDLQQHHGHAVQELRVEPVELVRLPSKAGAKLLSSLGVHGKDAELEAASAEFEGHSLALTLLGRYLAVFHAGDVCKAGDLPKLEGMLEERGRQARRIMCAYETVFHGKAELDILHILGLFDRLATGGAFKSLRVAPGISGLTDHTCWQTEKEWTLSVEALRDLRLLAPLDPKQPDTFDCHPLVREHFAEALKKRSMAAWREGHRRLYQFFSSTPDKPQPTLEDLQPLYQAVAHGCQAGITEEARAKVYRNRIQRGQEAYSTFKLGALGSDLGAIACFFKKPWSDFLPGISESGQAWLLNESAFSLRALGRPTEALEPMRAVTEMTARLGDWKNAAIDASNLSELELTLGEVAGAVGDAEQSVTYADRSGDAFQRMTKRITHADAQHQAGRRADAETRFREAEQMQQEMQPDYPLLYSMGGFRYCDLLLAAPERAAWAEMLKAKGQRLKEGQPISHSAFSVQPSALLQSCRAVSQRAVKMFEWRAANDSLLDIALDHLTLGRAALYRAILENSDLRLLTSDLSHTDAAVDGLRRAGTQDYLPRGLLTRAWLRFLTSARTGPESAQADLDEVWEIAERGPMRLHMADILLTRCRLFGAQKSEVRSQKPEANVEKYPWESPEADLAAARKLIEQCGYWRRKEELEDAEKAILGGS